MIDRAYSCPKCFRGNRKPSREVSNRGSEWMMFVDYSCGASLTITRKGCNYLPVWTKVCDASLNPKTQAIRNSEGDFRLIREKFIDDARKADNRAKHHHLFEVQSKKR